MKYIVFPAKPHLNTQTYKTPIKKMVMYSQNMKFAFNVFSKKLFAR